MTELQEFGWRLGRRGHTTYTRTACRRAHAVATRRTDRLRKNRDGMRAHSRNFGQTRNLGWKGENASPRKDTGPFAERYCLNYENPIGRQICRSACRPSILRRRPSPRESAHIETSRICGASIGCAPVISHKGQVCGIPATPCGLPQFNVWRASYAWANPRCLWDLWRHRKKRGDACRRASAARARARDEIK